MFNEEGKTSNIKKKEDRQRVFDNADAIRHNGSNQTWWIAFSREHVLLRRCLHEQTKCEGGSCVREFGGADR